MTSAILGIYINLEDREDRRVHMEQLIQSYPFFERVSRMDAICRTDNGAIGCGLSHLRALNILYGQLDTEDAIGMILEDDLCILQEEPFKAFQVAWEHIRDQSDWDVIVLTPRGEPMSDETTPMMRAQGFQRIHHHQTTTGYLLRKRMIPHLMHVYQSAVDRMSAGVPLDDCAIDQEWKPMQENYAFYYYTSVYAGQLVGYSNIEQRMINYNEQYLIQK